MHLSTLKRSNAFLAAQDGGREEAEATVNGEHHKSVTIAPKTHYMTDRHYVQRKPLFTEEHRVSILKKLPEMEEPSGLTMKQWVNPPQTHGLSLRDLSLPTASREKPSSTSIVPERCHREPPSGLTFHGRSAQRSFSSSILEVQSINPPLRPQLTSTVLNPTYMPRSCHPRISQAHLRSKEGSGVEGTKTSSSAVNSECWYQVDYWACAIPKALPPSPDRKSAAWNPNKEYEALLDYTYPLRPGHVSREWNSTELQEDYLLRTEPNMKDSGIELDHLCSSASLSGFEPSESGGGRSRDRSGSPDPQVFLASSDVPPCSTPLSIANLTSLSVDSLDCTRDRAGSDQSRNGDDYQHHAEAASSSAAFIRSANVLPRSRWVGGEVDEEFWPLPEQLEELQQLSRQKVREVAAQISPPATAPCASLDRDTTSTLPSITSSQKTPETAKDKQDGCEGTQCCAAETASGGRRSEALRSSGGVRGQLSVTGVRERLLKQLCDGQEQSDSLIEHIQLFCSQLELLIQQLYGLSQSMERIAAPAGDFVSVKSSLADYQSFQKELSSHQPLTSCVLRAGQHLLSCINSTSPFLKDTLLLIEKQTGALQNHSDHVFSSILSAMDTLALPTHHSPTQLREEKNSAGT
ncbi:centrosomal protein of 68 kDa isoform X3 [Poecilia latipinna]|uniref:centrosomal protein of 68 kDa isoform X3 n=1 Tax=Poecilia latipinna TaxID=48699 RepID=UPI00072E1081|nr:PREDICTED: centrosomal protein of 68 kDa isoform X3 [Poecilia latipinna]